MIPLFLLRMDVLDRLYPESTFDRPKQHASGKMLLQERINSDDRSAGNDDGSHLHGNGRYKLIRVIKRLLRLHQKIPHHHLQGPKISIRDIHNGRKELVSMTNRIEQADSHNRRNRERNDDADQQAKFLCTVHSGRFKQLFRQLFKEALHNEYVEAPDS